ncbi:hypothetical protein GWK10_12110 [Spongiivirga citrea]|uniref:Fibronectin type-III domain-containing protein n=2 Tax=Spongiivirga citrea TaxID=1481457 RepID=A0A6M0CJE2_9FLAO|nr:hypothetical protein [Spongiivirga citrea]
MKISSIKIIALAATALVGVSCGGGGDDGPPPPPPEGPAPTAATFVFPLDNTECNEGTNITENTSDVNFQWNAGQNTDTYDVTITNLNTNVVTTRNGLTATNVTVTINRGAPFSWQITSKSSSTTSTAATSTARFYNTGEPVENYAPFPASVIAPVMGSSIAAGTVGLSWTGSDIDNDITGYEVFFGTDSASLASAGTTDSGTTSLDVTASAGTVYFWNVVTTDGQGNTSTSEMFQFKTN